MSILLLSPIFLRTSGRNIMPTTKVRKSDMRQYDASTHFKSLTLFAGLSAEDIRYFADAAHIKNYKKDKLIFTEDEQAGYFYIILSGWIRLFHTTEEGEEINLAILTMNSLVGESSIFEEGRYTSSAQVAEAVQVLSIPINLLKEYLLINQQMAFNMLTIMTKYQRLHALQLELYHLYTAPQRIGCFLLGLCPPLDHRDGVKINLPYDKTLIAATLGMKGSTFSRALNILRKETGLQIHGTHVKIDSIKRLLDFVNGCYLNTLVNKV